MGTVNSLEAPSTRAAMVVLRTGWLTKEPIHPHPLSHPRRRFFVLTDNTLEYHENDLDTSSVPRGRVPLGGALIRKDREALTLTVVRADRTERLVLRGDDIEEWYTALANRIEPVAESAVPGLGPLEGRLAELERKLAASEARVSELETQQPVVLNAVSQQPNVSIYEAVAALAQKLLHGPSSSASRAKALSDKFAASGDNFVFYYGDESKFHEGLEGHIGTPSADIHQAMEYEHRSTEAFDSHNVFGTTPRLEWLYVVEGVVGNAAGREEDAPPERLGWRLANFVSQTRCRVAGLLEEEVIGIRLYTGPMYIHYNSRILRNGVKGEFVTTIHAINSAIIKLARQQPACEVYRGVRGGILPKEFWTANAHGVMGGVELGMMSTTTDRSVAMRFAKTGVGPTKCSMIFQIRMGMIDRGADVVTARVIPTHTQSKPCGPRQMGFLLMRGARGVPQAFLSQFPAESEILFGPLTGLEVISSPTIVDNTIVVQLRLSTNQHACTIEKVVAKLKTSHLELVQLIIDDFTANGVPSSALQSLRNVRTESEARDGSYFNVADHFQAATAQIFEARAAAFTALRGETTWADATRAALMCAREGEHEAAVDLLRSARLQVDGGERWHLRVAHWMIEQGLPQPLPATFVVLLRMASSEEGDTAAHANLETIFARLVGASSLPKRDVVEVGRQVMALEKFQWERAFVTRVGPTPAAAPVIAADAAEGVERGSDKRRSDGADRRSDGADTPREVSVVQPAKQVVGAATTVAAAAACDTDTVTVDVKVGGCRVVTGLALPRALVVNAGGAGALLRAAAAAGSAALVGALLQAGVSALVADQSLNTALHLAADAGHVDVCRLLLAAKSDPDVQNARGQGAKTMAFTHKHVAVTRLFKPPISDEFSGEATQASKLLRAAAGGDLKALRAIKDAATAADPKTGHTALMVASRGRQLEATKFLLERGAAVNARSVAGRLSALHLAAEEGAEAVLELLIQARAEVNLPAADGSGALVRACYNDNTDAARLLLARGADVNQQATTGLTAMHYCAIFHYPHSAQMLLEHGAAVELKSTNGGITALMYACQLDSGDTARVLLDHGASVHTESDLGYTALYYCCQQGFEALARLCIEHGAVVDHPSQTGYTPLMHSCKNGHILTSRLLLDKGADVNRQKLDDGTTALHRCAIGGHTELAKLLLDHSATIDMVTKGRGWSPLFHACKQGNDDVVRLLIERGAVVGREALEAKGLSTPLLVASQYGHATIVRLLIDGSADVDRQNANGWTALMFACHYGHAVAVQALLQASASVSLQNRNGLTALSLADKASASDHAGVGGPEWASVYEALRQAGARP